MNYTKPEVAVLGEAVRVIESHVKGTIGTPDGGQFPKNRLSPAYDLDE
jgi:hypothetical protein